MKENARFTLMIWRMACCATLLLLVVCPVFAQSDTGRIEGTITDPGGAVVAGATVTAINAATNTRADATTNEEGFYSLPSLRVGVYTLEISAPNFSKQTRPNLELEVSQVARIDAQLQAGNVAETVTVSDALPLVDTSSSAIGEVVQGRQIVELPLNGRNVLELARLVPGVTQGVPGGFATGAGGNAETFRGGNTGGAALSVNGQRTQANNFLLDGLDNNESLVNTIQIFPQAEAVQEFRVQTSVATAEFGRGGGAIINTVIRSGRNDFYGSLFTFIRNDNLDARPTFDRTKNEFRRGQFGGSVGGPLYLPRFGEGGRATTAGRDKLFFFGDYQGLRQFLPLGLDTATVPTAAFRRGDFSALLDPTRIGNTIQLRDPITGLPIAGNRLDLLPGNRLNQAGLNYLNAFPLPNNGNGVQGNYQNTRVQTLNENTADVRVDYNASERNQIFVRGSYGRDTSTTSSRLPTLPSGFGSGDNFTRTRGLAIGVTSAFTQRTVNELRVGASRIFFGFLPPFGNQPVSANLGIANANTSSLLGGGALIGGFNGQLEYTGDFGPFLVPQNTYQVSDSVSHTAGKHTFRFGGTFLRRDVNLFRPNRGKGFFFLVGNGNADGISITGFEQSDLLIGFVRNYSIGPPFGFVGTRNYENAGFGQDDYRVSRKLTLNLGLRYEYFTNPTETRGRQANFDINTGRLRVAQSGSDALVNTDRNNFGPRAGFAYDLTGNGRTVIRGGYGIFYFLDRGGIDNQLAQNPPFSGFSSFDYNNGFRFTLSGQAPNGSNDSRLATAPLPTGSVANLDVNNPRNVSVLAILPDNKTSQVQQYNVQIQRQLTRDTALSVGYVGTRGSNLSFFYNLNSQPFNAPSGTRRFSNLSDVNVRDDIGRSTYNSLQVQLDHRFSRGLQYLASYTFSKTRDNSSGAFEGGRPQDITNFVAESGNSSVDFPHVFSFSSVYDIPFGRGRRFGTNLPHALDYVIGGYQVNTILRLQSGQTFDVNIDGARADLVGDPYNSANGAFLNRAAFARAPQTSQGVFTRVGNLTRNGLRSPSLKQLNLGLAKNFGLRETTRLQFRGEFFNLTNTPQFTPPNTNFGDVNNFGRLQGTQLFTNRQIQLGLRLEF